MAAAPDDRLHPPTNGGQPDGPGGIGDVAAWTQHLAKQNTIAVGGQLPPHSSNCSGCGPDNPAGLQLQAFRTVTGVEAVHSFSDLHQGAPGIAHGGAVALAFDDLFGFALYTVGLLAVTRGLTVDYQAPFRLHHPYTFHAEVAEQTGRRLLLHGDAWDESGSKVGFADATFIVVEPAHFVATIEPRPDFPVFAERRTNASLLHQGPGLAADGLAWRVLRAKDRAGVSSRERTRRICPTLTCVATCVSDSSTSRAGVRLGSAGAVCGEGGSWLSSLRTRPSSRLAPGKLKLDSA